MRRWYLFSYSDRSFCYTRRPFSPLHVIHALSHLPERRLGPPEFAGVGRVDRIPSVASMNTSTAHPRFLPRTLHPQGKYSSISLSPGTEIISAMAIDFFELLTFPLFPGVRRLRRLDNHVSQMDDRPQGFPPPGECRWTATAPRRFREGSSTSRDGIRARTFPRGDTVLFSPGMGSTMPLCSHLPLR